jgi:hypothetical protein
MPKKLRNPEKASGPADPLGRLIAQYPPRFAGVLLVSGVVAIIGAGLVGFSLLRESTSIILLAIGGFILLVAIVFVGMNLINLGRRLELRKRGLRFTEGGEETDILWQDVADVTVRRTDNTNLGAVRVWQTSANYLAPSGPLTRTSWDITIQSHDGAEIHLGPTFLKIVPNVPKLISQMRLAGGQKGKS